MVYIFGVVISLVFVIMCYCATASVREGWVTQKWAVSLIVNVKLRFTSVQGGSGEWVAILFVERSIL